MHINAKYYVISVSSIFISLGVGILVGFNLNYDEELSKQQTSIINDLDVKFERLRETNTDLKSKLEKSNKDYNNVVNFVNDNAYKLLSGELSGRNIGIITIGENNDLDYVKNSIEVAGGDVSFNICFKSKALDKDSYLGLSEKLGVEVNNLEQLSTYILDILNDKNLNAKEKLKPLEDFNLIKINSLESNSFEYTSVVLSNKGEIEDFNCLDKLIDKLKVEDKHVIGVEATNVKESLLESYSKNKISAINNIDENIGQLALVLALKDKNMVNNFGTSENSQNLISYRK